MGVYNSNAGDVGYLTDLAQRYALSDNYHQAIMGGTGANQIAIGLWRCDVLCRFRRQPGDPAPNQMRTPTDARHQQLVHPGRVCRRVLRQLR